MLNSRVSRERVACSRTFPCFRVRTRRTSLRRGDPEPGGRSTRRGMRLPGGTGRLAVAGLGEDEDDGAAAVLPEDAPRRHPGPLLAVLRIGHRELDRPVLRPLQEAAQGVSDFLRFPETAGEI